MVDDQRRRIGPREPLPAQGLAAVRPGRRSGRRCGTRPRGRISESTDLRHGRHQHRCRTDRRPLHLAAGAGNRPGPRSRSRLADRYRGGRRRIDLPLAERPARGRPGERRSRSRARLLRARRAPDADRCQSAARSDGSGKGRHPARPFGVGSAAATASNRNGRGRRGDRRRIAAGGLAGDRHRDDGGSHPRREPAGRQRPAGFRAARLRRRGPAARLRRGG